MIEVYGIIKPVRIKKTGRPDGQPLGNFQSVLSTNKFRESSNWWANYDELAFYCTDRKRLVRRYEVDDWGRQERIA